MKVGLLTRAYMYIIQTYTHRDTDAPVVALLAAR